MKRIRIIDINIPFVKRIFHLRFKVAGLTRKSKIINKITKKALFSHDATYFIPSPNSVTTVSESIDVNKEFETPDQIVMPTDIIKSFIMEADDIVIMNKCLCRYSTDCTDYPKDLGCIFLGKTTRKISRKYCHEATREEAIEHINKCDEAGLIHIAGRNKMDTVWMGVDPGDELLTICNCCPCCCLWRVYPKLSNEIQNDFHKLPGISVYCENNECIHCNKCIDVCYAQCISIVDNKIVIDEDVCIGCGSCSNNCPTNAMKLNYEKKNINSVFDKIHGLVKIDSK